MMKKDKIKLINPISAYELINGNNDSILIDVRCELEHDYIGHPMNSINIVWKKYPSWEINQSFAEEVDKALSDEGKASKNTSILLICRSGARSMDAAQCLLEENYCQLYNVEEGFEGDKNSDGQRSSVNGWRFHGLPWLQG